MLTSPDDGFLKQERDHAMKRIDHKDSFFVIGLPGIGKSLFLHTLGQHLTLTNKFVPVVLDLNEVDNVSLDQVNTFLLKELSATLQQNFASFDALSTYAQTSTLPIVCLIDRFEKTFILEGHFFDSLRWLINNSGKSIMFVFSVDKTIEPLQDIQAIDQLYSPLSPFTYYLKPFDEITSKEILAQELVQRNAHIPEEVQQEIIARSGGHIRLLKAYLQTIVLQSDVQEVDWNRIDNVEAVLLQCRRVLSALSESERQALVAFVQAVAETQPTQAMDALRKIGIITENGKLFSERFTKYIAETESQGTIRTLTLHQNGEIFFKDIRIDDQLSKQEYLLLAALLEELGTIITRDAIIEKVWGEAAGVSDEAIDQIVARVRTKLESFGGDKEMIKTLRGRGFQLQTG